jgi:hypothetical protein
MTFLIRCSPVTGEDALLALEATAERLLAAGDAGRGLTADGARRLRRIGEELSVNVLAVRVLVSAGASPERVDPLLERAAALIDDEWIHRLRLVESTDL